MGSTMVGNELLRRSVHIFNIGLFDPACGSVAQIQLFLARSSKRWKNSSNAD